MENCEVLLYLKVSMLASLSLMAPGQAVKLLGQRQRISLFTSIAIYGPWVLHAYSGASVPTGDVERAGDMNTLNEFCYRNAGAGEPDSSFSGRNTGMTSAYNKCKNAKAPWNWLST